MNNMTWNLLFVLSFVLTCSSSMAYKIDGPVTVSGISSGGFFAVQYHVAHSSIVRGAAILSGGPYYCAQNNVEIALHACMSDPDLLLVDPLIAETDYARACLSIDSLDDFKKTTAVLLVHGTADTMVKEGVVHKLGKYYAHWLDEDKIHWNISEKSGHGWPTIDFGVPCEVTAPPYLMSCNIDMGERIFSTLLTDRKQLKPKGKASNDSYISIDQESFIPLPYTTLTTSMNDQAYAYVPQACRAKYATCQLHIAFHGCEMTVGDIGLDFVERSGLNEWAETNDMIVLYPQLAKNDVLNPKGCWDFWGYTGVDYSVRIAAQIMTVKSMADSLHY